jgi:hypothetical protein
MKIDLSFRIPSAYFLKENDMKFLIKLVAVGVLLMSSFSAYASYCELGGYGHCIWGFDKKDSQNINLIDGTLFMEFCNKNNIYCSSLNNGKNSIMGRYLHSEIFLIASKGYGGPDLILQDKAHAQRFATAFKAISANQETRFFVKNDEYPTHQIVAVGYQAKTSEGREEIKLLFLPNEWEANGDDYAYTPPDE